MEEELEEEQFDFRKGEGIRDATGLIRTIGERYREKYKDVYGVFVDPEKHLTEWTGRNSWGS